MLPDVVSAAGAEDVMLRATSLTQREQSLMKNAKRAACWIQLWTQHADKSRDLEKTLVSRPPHTSHQSAPITSQRVGAADCCGTAAPEGQNPHGGPGRRGLPAVTAAAVILRCQIIAAAPLSARNTSIKHSHLRGDQDKVSGRGLRQQLGPRHTSWGRTLARQTGRQKEN